LTFDKPVSPTLESVHFEPVDNGLFIKTEDAIKLADNIDKLKSQLEKYELLVKTMEDYYLKELGKK